MSKVVRFVSVVSLGLLVVFAVTSCRTAEPSSAQASQEPAPPEQPAAAAQTSQSAPSSEPLAPAAATSAVPVSQTSTPSRQAAAPAVATTPPAQEPDSSPPVPQVEEDPNVVAKIVDFVITKDELKQRCLQMLRPRSEGYIQPVEPVTAEDAALALISEKAMMIEARRLGYLNDPQLGPYVRKYRREKLGTALLMDQLRGNLSVDDAEVDKMLESNSKLTREQARMLVERSKAISLLEQFRKQLWEKYHVRHVTENFAKASAIHERLLNEPAKPRTTKWIGNDQVRDELSQEEKNIVLATFDGGQVTVQNWLEVLCDIVPPRRPKNLNTPEGVGTLVDTAVRPLVLDLEAKARGYDKNPEYVRAMKEYEDRNLLWKLQGEKARSIAEPNEDQIKAFFEAHKDWFAKPATLRVDQVWCSDLAAAEEVKAKLEGGEDFESVWKQYSVEARNYTPPPSRPAWLLYADEAAGLGGEKVSVGGTVPDSNGTPQGVPAQLERGGFKVTAARGAQMSVTILDDGRIVYWEGRGLIEKVATKERFSLPEPKRPDPFEMLMTISSEGIFWDELWKGEPNQVIGPVKGLQADGVRWRVVKILEKKPAEARPYSEQMAGPVKWAFMAQQREAVLDSYGKELRDKYGYEVYAERIRDFDPLEAVTGEIKR